jgi:hypothetical protein
LNVIRKTETGTILEIRNPQRSAWLPRPGVSTVRFDVEHVDIFGYPSTPNRIHLHRRRTGSYVSDVHDGRQSVGAPVAVPSDMA